MRTATVVAYPAGKGLGAVQELPPDEAVEMLGALLERDGMRKIARNTYRSDERGVDFTLRVEDVQHRVTT